MLTSKFLLSIFLTCLGFACCDDYYSSTVGLKKLLDAEKLMVEIFENFIESERYKHEQIKYFIADVEEELKEMLEKNYFENPLNAIKVLRRVVRDWYSLYGVLTMKTNREDYQKEIESLHGFEYNKPLRSDIEGAANGVARLQKTYQLNTTELANGYLMNLKASAPMSKSDCFELGAALIAKGDYENAISWLMETRLRIKLENSTVFPKSTNTLLPLKDNTVLDVLIPVTYTNKNYALTLWLIEEKLALDPKNTLALDFKSKVKAAQLEESIQLLDRELKLFVVEEEKNKTTPVMELYEKTCRGELKPSPAVQRNLRCKFENYGIPFCVYAPFKIEQLNEDPSITYFYDVIYESEIKGILAAAENTVKRSAVGVTVAKKSTVSELRTSQNTWLYFENEPFLDNLAQRLIDITGLALTTAEPLQVANYGIGGHYAPHFDFSEDDEFTFYGKGNRLLTALFYINEVELGGATVFPFLQLAVPPVRRGMVLWYNLHSSLERDYRTKHAGCPVLKGSKWICNEWFHERDQEFYFPCSLTLEGNKSISYSPSFRKE